MKGPQRFSAVPVTWLALLGLIVSFPHALVAQSGGVIVGEVLDGVNRTPIRGAVITVADVGLRAETDALGQFEFQEVPAGATLIRVDVPGYSSLIAVALDELLVTARRRGATESRIEPPAREGAETSSAHSAVDLLSETAPGVFVMVPNGYVDSRASVLVRGIKSVTMSGRPAIYVDGIRVSGGSHDSGFPGGRALSVLDQLSASEIAEIKLLRGPAATIEYPEATNGVILIRTKTGRLFEDR
jgi:outer membrane receptor protein involved in Fe transport